MQKPEGMSSYQADWFVDDSGKPIKALVGDDERDLTDADEGEDEEADPFAGDDHIMSAADEDADLDDGVNVQGRIGSSAKERAERAAEDMEFPDEVNTPLDVPARQRFARYRALQSFRSSPWHPKENLPQDYARIFQFENFAGIQRRHVNEASSALSKQEAQLLQSKHSKKAAARSHGGSAEHHMEVDEHEEAVQEESGAGKENEDNHFAVPGMDRFVEAGQHVSIELEGIAAEKVQEQLQLRGYLTAFNLFPHENKLSVLHFNIQRVAGYEEPIKSKDPLLFVAGMRSFMCRPLFSESNLNCDKHKFERFLQVSATMRWCSHQAFRAIVSAWRAATALPATLGALFKFLNSCRRAEHGCWWRSGVF